jgi:hypothetical protein
MGIRKAQLVGIMKLGVKCIWIGVNYKIFGSLEKIVCHGRHKSGVISASA